MTPNIYLIEDDFDVRTALTQAFELEDHRVAAFASAEACLPKIPQHAEAVVVTDVRLPKADGEEVLKLVQTFDPDLPVILITGHGDVPMAVRCLKFGAFDFFEKPLDAMALVTSVRNALKQRRLILLTRQLATDLEMEDKPLSEQVNDFEKLVLERALKLHRGRLTEVMNALDLPRKTLSDKMAKHGLKRESFT
ncbi:response regulator [uncultured Roseovarius sp.]|uniref:response regulator n=1 Tax=uncultured Roseovarius sp. TaxID=293344 RepID=UPI0026282F0A|nr:response regulator [uncultured Roseovarius sp.]